VYEGLAEKFLDSLVDDHGTPQQYNGTPQQPQQYNGTPQPTQQYHNTMAHHNHHNNTMAHHYTILYSPLL
jgi:hypothetical protein